MSMPVVDRIASTRPLVQLPPRLPHGLYLHDIEGHEHEEIARMPGLLSRDFQVAIAQGGMNYAGSLGNRS